MEKSPQLEDLLLQALETEMGGIQIYAAALRAVQNKDLAKEWKEYHEQTTHHEQIVRDTLEALGLDPQKDTAGRQVVRHLGASLVKAIDMAITSGSPEAAELVAAECVVLAETKDHLNWELLSEMSDKLKGEARQVLKKACKEVEEEEDEHLYHTQGWSRELWIQALAMPAVLPPPEEEKDVKTAIGAARARHARKKML